MPYPYGMIGPPAVGRGLGGLPRRGTNRGEILWCLPGTYSWTVPPDVSSPTVCAVAIGGGGSGFGAADDSSSGGGGALAWANNIPVSPGQVITVVVGAGGSVSVGTSFDGGTSSFGTACVAEGGKKGATTVVAQGGAVLTGNGGKGGNGATSKSPGNGSASSGGGAGGYSGAGGNGVAASGAGGQVNGNPGTGGGGGSGSVDSSTNKPSGSGGVGPWGEGISGSGGIAAVGNPLPGGGGSGGENGFTTQLAIYSVRPSQFGAGGTGSAALTTGGLGGNGAVRIVWGPNRSFPSSNVSQN